MTNRTKTLVASALISFFLGVLVQTSDWRPWELIVRPKTINVLSFGQFLTQDELQSLQLDLGLKLEVTEFQSHQSFFERITLQQDSWDLVLGFDGQLMAVQELLLPLDHNLLPQTAQIPKDFYPNLEGSSDFYSIPMLWSFIVVAGNEEFSWQNLWLSKQESSLVLDELIYPNLYIAFGRYLEQFHVDENQEDALKNALTLITKKLSLSRDNIISSLINQANSEIATNKAFLFNSASIAQLGWTSEQVQKQIKMPLEGLHYWSIHMGINKNSKHQDLSLKLANYLLEAPQMSKMAKKTQLASTLPHVDSELSEFQKTKYFRTVALSKIKPLAYDKTKVLWLEQNYNKLKSESLEADR